MGTVSSVIGVHSPKFPHEADHAAVARAVARHRITHPVLDDPWRPGSGPAAAAWPTLVVIDPDGYVVAMASGEGNAAALGDVIQQLLDGRSDLGVGPAFTPVAVRTGDTLAFPGKVAWDRGGQDGHRGHGQRSRARVWTSTGRSSSRRISINPRVCVSTATGSLVCDTVAGEVVAVGIAGGERHVLASGLHSPWDVLVIPDGRIAVAEAGVHRIVALPAQGGAVEVLAGSRAEGLRDGRAREAHLAEPSGLTLLDGNAIAFANSEVSALRVLRDGKVETLVGTGLFDWGATDGRSRHRAAAASARRGGVSGWLDRRR